MDEQGAQSDPHDDGESRLSREQGHVFKNIFSIILANAEMIGEDSAVGGQLRRRLERIGEACRRGEQLVQQIRSPQSPVQGPAPSFDPTLPPSMPPGRVLVVDDEVDVVEIIRRYLSREGLIVQGCADGKEALEWLQANPFQIDLVITDFDMPHLSGAALCEHAHLLRPDLPVVMITGYDRRVASAQLASAGIRAVLLKPLDKNELLNTVRRLMPA